MSGLGAGVAEKSRTRCGLAKGPGVPAGERNTRRPEGSELCSGRQGPSWSGHTRPGDLEEFTARNQEATLPQARASNGQGRASRGRLGTALATSPAPEPPSPLRTAEKTYKLFSPVLRIRVCVTCLTQSVP